MLRLGPGPFQRFVGIAFAVSPKSDWRHQNGIIDTPLKSYVRNGSTGTRGDISSTPVGGSDRMIMSNKDIQGLLPSDKYVIKGKPKGHNAVSITHFCRSRV